MNITKLTVRVAAWIRRSLGESILMSKDERTMRIVEEAIELAQAEGIEFSTIAAISRRVYDRPAGEPEQELGGLQVCILAYAFAADKDLAYLTEREVERIEGVPSHVTLAKHNAKAAAGTALASELGGHRIQDAYWRK